MDKSYVMAAARRSAGYCLSRRIAPALVVLLACASGARADTFWKAEDVPRSRFETDYLKLDGHAWLINGTDSWSTSYVIPVTPLTSGAPDAGFEGSTLEFEHKAEPMFVVSGEVKITKKLSLGAEYGFASNVTGNAYDHDWVTYTSPDQTTYLVYPDGTILTNPDHYDYSRSRSTLGGSVKLFSGALYYRIADHVLYGTDKPVTGGLDVFAGYGVYDDRFSMTNGCQLDSRPMDYYSVPDVGPFSGLNSRYYFHWEGAKVGLREMVTVSDRLAMTGSVGWWPAMKFEGEGYWNLRSDLRQGQPSFTHSADGMMLEYALLLDFRLFKGVVLNAGYRGQQFHSSDGTATFYYSDGETATIHLDEADSVRYGWYGGVSIQF